ALSKQVLRPQGPGWNRGPLVFARRDSSRVPLPPPPSTRISKGLYNATPEIPYFNPAFRDHSHPYQRSGFAFLISRDVGDYARSRRFLQPSACVFQPDPHPGVDVLLITKAQPQFDRAVDRAVEALFCVLYRSNRR